MNAMQDRAPELPPEPPSFEACLGALQEIVGALEEGTLGLDESIACFERGVSLLRCCYQALEQAEERIELLTGFDEAGNPQMRAFDGAATLNPSKSTPGKRAKNPPARKQPSPDDEPSPREDQPLGGQLF